MYFYTLDGDIFVTIYLILLDALCFFSLILNSYNREQIVPGAYR